MPAGYTTQAGIAREATVYARTWPGLPAQVTELLPLQSEDVQTSLDQSSLITRESRSVPERAVVTRQFSPGNITTNLSFQGSELFFLGAMGQQAIRIEGDPQPEELVSMEVYRHLFEVDPEIATTIWKAGDGFIAGDDDIIAGQRKVRAFTFASRKNGVVWETNSCMIDSLTIQGNPSGGVTLSAEIVGYDTIYGSTVNANIGNVSLSYERILFQDCFVYMRPLSAGAITPSDLFDTNGFQIQIANNLEYMTTRETGIYIEEPTRQSCIVTAGIALPRWTTQDFFQENYAHEPMSIRIDCIGTEIGNTGLNRQIRFYLPNCMLTGAEGAALGPEQIIQNYSFMALATSNAIDGPPTGTTGGPILVEVINEVPTNYLV